METALTPAGTGGSPSRPCSPPSKAETLEQILGWLFEPVGRFSCAPAISWAMTSSVSVRDW